ncbi:hypothetical protein [Agromyces albus]|uniref:hypothetical protein n=1 Tax=Agromyces albus TaxID=205332 RepID=UPI00278B7AD5|nr:hypothetical protein [Agromyces albus]MDQ0575991.1 hypothetical protein [Agromyces albus]
MTSLMSTALFNERARPFLVFARELAVVAGQAIFSIAALGASDGPPGGRRSRDPFPSTPR